MMNTPPLVSRSLGLAPALLFALALGCSSNDPSSAKQPVDAGPSVTKGPEPTLPAAPADCPVLQTGTMDLFGSKGVVLRVGERQADKKGPVLFYFHGTGSVAAEMSAFWQTAQNPILDEIAQEGGIAVSFETTVATLPADNPNNTGNGVWYTNDYGVADSILACAVQQLNIDTRRIYAAGCSAGGLESGTMAMMRSSYLAAVVTNSGGHILPSGIGFEDPTHIPAVISAHGTYDNDFVILHFTQWARHLDQQIVGAGGLSTDCTTPNGHCMLFPPTTIDPAPVVAAWWQFLKDHPFGTTTDPYADGLPSSFPAFCQNVTVGGDQ